ncbi:hypothetical protein HDV00_005188 [Rhizophlyctis rosea]|nr:hypothetical protein HDV00_005188 [Rhizophlyctis rosea]
MSQQGQPQMQTVYASPPNIDTNGTQQQPGGNVYSPTATMNAGSPGNGQPGQGNVVVVTQVVQRPPKNWAATLFDCFGEGAFCLFAWCCPCCAFGRNRQMLNKTDEWLGDCCVYCIAQTFGCWSCIGAGSRAAIRTKYNITGDANHDWLVHCCCTSCALTQEKREIEEMIKAGLN